MNLQILSLLLSLIIFINLIIFILFNNSVKIESMTNNENTSLEDSFCEVYESSDTSMELNGACNKLTRDNCLNTKCCVWGKNSEGEKCYAGSKNGHTFKTDNDGNNINMDSYYHMNKCYGNC